MRSLQRVMVIGSGTMGHGIAQVAAMAGFDVSLNDIDAERIARGIESIDRNLAKGIERGKLRESKRAETLNRIRAAPEMADAARRADLVIEAVPEDLSLKQDLLRQAGESAPDHAVLATNTSSLPVGEIARATPCPDRVVGMHFFNPVHLMPLLEVVRAESTADGTLQSAVDAGRRMGKEPIVVRDAPGFASSRLGVVLGLEAMRMLESDVASAEDIDKAMTLGYRHPMGPLRLTDLVGLDVRLAIAEHLHRALDSETFRPPEILRRKVREGKLGKKSGEGFYVW